MIHLLEQNACLWDVFSKEYHLRDKLDKAYETMQEELDIPIADILDLLGKTPVLNACHQSWEKQRQFTSFS